MLIFLFPQSSKVQELTCLYLNHFFLLLICLNSIFIPRIFQYLTALKLCCRNKVASQIYRFFFFLRNCDTAIIKNQFLKNLCSGFQCGGFQFLPILDLWGISFYAVVVFGLGKSFLFKFALGHCATLLMSILNRS